MLTKNTVASSVAVAVALLAGTLSSAHGAAASPARSLSDSHPTIQRQAVASSPDRGDVSGVVASSRSASGARITCYFGYTDWPHPGKSSNRRKINAHLNIDCNGPKSGLTYVNVRSTMHSRKREGRESADGGWGHAKTGGDLRCIKKKRLYRAHGKVYIKFPPRHTPQTATGSPKSKKRVFKKNRRGKCFHP